MSHTAADHIQLGLWAAADSMQQCLSACHKDEASQRFPSVSDSLSMKTPS